MMRRSLARVIFLCAWGASVAAAADPPFPVEPFPYPFRSAGASRYLLAHRFNPASLGVRGDVEFGWFHHTAERSQGGSNSLTLRARTLAGSVSWVKSELYGNRREYLLAGGQQVSPQGALGVSYRYIKADRSSLQNQSIWTFALLIMPSPQWWLGARWENPLHSKVDGQPTRGEIVAGLRAMPWGPKYDLTVDWFYPEGANLKDTEFRFAARITPTRGIDLRGWVDTEKRVGIELRVIADQSAAGAEVRARDYTDYTDGTLYITALNREYDNATQSHGRARR
jgi:hypothetical protein